MASVTQVLVVGGKGRLGSIIANLAKTTSGFSLAGIVQRGDVVSDQIASCDVVIDVSHPRVIKDVAQAAIKSSKPLVIGTTGHLQEEREFIAKAAATIPVLLAPNFSIGVNLLFYLTSKAAEILGSTSDQEIIEMHHRNKLDAPSGTAARLAEILVDAQASAKPPVIHGRQGETGPRKNEIAIHALRGGDVVGDHTVIFAGPGERLELTHKASTRETFALGALRSAAWIVGQPAGLYSMQDVLGLK